jgi:hypothetical protein
VENRVGHKLFPGAQAKVRPSLILDLLATATFSSEIRRGFDFWVVYLIYSMVYIIALRYNQNELKLGTNSLMLVPAGKTFQRVLSPRR